MESSLFKKPSSGTGGSFGKPKPLIKCAGLGGSSSSIAQKKAVAVPKKPKSGVFEAKK